AAIHTSTATDTDKKPVTPKASAAPANGSGELNGKKVIQESAQKGLSFLNSADAPPCMSCGSASMVRNGSCYKCLNCGATSGCS
ncbi:MAG: hypothetical protein ACAI44_27235, partial [Candidatus Sericytochromatia bacterium]